MTQRTWLITGVSSGFGRELTEQLLARGDVVGGTVRDVGRVSDLVERHPRSFHPELLDVTDAAAVHALADRAFVELGRIDVIVSNAGYGLFGAAEELTDAQVEHIVATNLVGPIHLIRAALPRLRAQGGGRVIQISSYGGQVALAGNSLYHATREGSGPRRPGPNGRPHHRERRCRSGSHADRPRLGGAREHRRHAPGTDRGLRGAVRARRLDRLPTRRVRRRSQLVELQGKQPTAKAPTDRFVGDAWVDPIAFGEEPSRVRVNVVRFAPGARNA
jgi:short chain dehydrogenase